MQQIPLVPFEKLEPTTITLTVPLPHITVLNLKAIYLLLPLSPYAIHHTNILRSKQGKVIYPIEYNVPGEILSLRYGEYTRGIKRTNSAAFPTSITIDIGTSIRPISIKFSQTIKLTGAPNFKIVDEAVNNLLQQIIQANEYLKYVQNNLEIAFVVRQKFFDRQANYTPEEQTIKDIFNLWTREFSTDDEKIGFLDTFILEFSGALYEGELTPGKCQSEMINLPFELGFTVNQQAIAKVFNEYPFECCYNNVRTSTTIMVIYHTHKIDRQGKKIPAQYSFRINKSGYVTHSGSSLEEMKYVYYQFLKQILLHLPELKSIEDYSRKVKIKPMNVIYDIHQWYQLVRENYALQQSILEQYV